MATFQSRLQEAMDEKGISQAELSRRTGITRTSISKYLRGTFKAKQNYLYILAKVLDVNEAWLMGLDANKKRPNRLGDELPPESLINAKHEKSKSVDDLVDEMHSYRGLKISEDQRDAMKALLKAYLDSEIKRSARDDQSDDDGRSN